MVWVQEKNAGFEEDYSMKGHQIEGRKVGLSLHDTRNYGKHSTNDNDWENG